MYVFLAFFMNEDWSLVTALSFVIKLHHDHHDSVHKEQIVIMSLGGCSGGVAPSGGCTKVGVMGVGPF